MAKKLIPSLDDGLHIKVEICPDRTIFRICDAKNEQFAYISLDVKEENIESIDHSLNIENFRVFNNLEERLNFRKK